MAFGSLFSLREFLVPIYKMLLANLHILILCILPSLRKRSFELFRECVYLCVCWERGIYQTIWVICVRQKIQTIWGHWICAKHYSVYRYELFNIHAQIYEKIIIFIIIITVIFILQVRKLRLNDFSWDHIANNHQSQHSTLDSKQSSS